jgi:hypothetical protein
MTPHSSKVALLICGTIALPILVPQLCFMLQPALGKDGHAPQPCLSLLCHLAEKMVGQLQSALKNANLLGILHGVMPCADLDPWRNNRLNSFNVFCIAVVVYMGGLASPKRLNNSRVSVQVEVAQTLTALRVPFLEEHIAPGGLHAVDFFVRGPRGQQIAVEADGPSHFSRVLPHEATGETVARDRVLQCLGWSLISVNCTHLVALRGQEERCAWLWRRLMLATSGPNTSLSWQPLAAPWEETAAAVRTAVQPSCGAPLQGDVEWWNRGGPQLVNGQ